MTVGEIGIAGFLAGGAASAWAGHPGMAAAAVVAGVGWTTLASARPELRLFGPARTHVRPDGIALTVDDGPDPQTTPRLLRVLADAGAHATFFLLGDRAASHPGLVADIVAGGHEIGLHGREHSAVATWLPRRRGAAWLEEGCRRLQAAGAGGIRWFRPPFGAVSPPLYASAAAAGLEVVWCSLRSGDGVRIAGATLRRRLARARPGDIVLVHEREPTVEVLADVLRDWPVVRSVGELA